MQVNFLKKGQKFDQSTKHFIVGQITQHVILCQLDFRQSSTTVPHVDDQLQCCLCSGNIFSSAAFFFFFLTFDLGYFLPMKMGERA